MQVFRPTAPIEQKLSKVEALMREQGLSLEWTHQGFLITDTQTNSKGYIRDTESQGTPTGFPRMFDSERLVIPEG